MGYVLHEAILSDRKSLNYLKCIPLTIRTKDTLFNVNLFIIVMMIKVLSIEINWISSSVIMFRSYNLLGIES
jgi:hypothetical protein